MKSIVVPINFSACAHNAACYAADMALALKTDLHLIHVIQVPVTTAEIGMTEYLYQEMIDAADASLKGLQVELGKRTHSRIGIKITIEAGGLALKVKDLCTELKPYAVIVGASGPTLEKFLTGSPVAALLHSLRYPVLVVPETAAFHHFRRVLLACDLEDIGSGLPHFHPFLKDLREHFGSRFDIVTVETKKVLADEQSVFEGDAWKEQLKELYPELHLVHTHKVQDGLMEYLNHHDADLVMVFPKKHRLFDFHVSQSRKFAQHSPIPVMSLHG
jgi:nucleotide-binding universal stress UspA family protein